MTTRLLAIDPGSERSAWLVFRDGQPVSWGLEDNAEVLALLRTGFGAPLTAIERIESYGMAVGREVFETVRWAGRFEEAVQWHRGRVELVPRREVKVAVCGDTRARDANIRTALVDRWGGVSATRKGGPLYGIARDVWSALAIAVTVAERRVPA